MSEDEDDEDEDEDEVGADDMTTTSETEEKDCCPCPKIVGTKLLCSAVIPALDAKDVLSSSMSASTPSDDADPRKKQAKQGGVPMATQLLPCIAQ